MINRLAFIEVVVKDINTALDWYTRVLGFQAPDLIVSNEDGRWVRLVSAEGDKSLALWQPPAGNPNLGVAHRLSFVPVFAVDDIYSTVERLVANGAGFTEGIRERKDYRITSLLDCEGNRLQLFEEKASSE